MATGTRPDHEMELPGVHPSDPFPLGYTLSDTWGPGKPRD